MPHGYTAADHARDHDAFGAWLKENYPNCLFVGPCTVGDIDMFGAGMDGAGGGNTWASTYADVPRTLNELGEFTSVTDGVILPNIAPGIMAYGVIVIVICYVALAVIFKLDKKRFM